MSQHPQTTRFRNLAQESEDGWAIDQLCDLLDAQYAQTESALAELADGGKPRVVTTVEELDALPIGRIIADRDGDAWQRTSGGWDCTVRAWNTTDQPSSSLASILAPFTDLPTPDPTR